MRRRRRIETVGKFEIRSPGISERVDASAPSLGAALSKAQTIGSRLQRELMATEDEDVTISIAPIGGERLARVVVRRDVIETFA